MKTTDLVHEPRQDKSFVGCVGGWRMADRGLYIFLRRKENLYQAIFDPSSMDKKYLAHLALTVKEWSEKMIGFQHKASPPVAGIDQSDGRGG